MQGLERSNVKHSRKFFQEEFKKYLRLLLKETDYERRDYLQHQLRTLMKLIRERQREG
jgi:hypothetical protein